MTTAAGITAQTPETTEQMSPYRRGDIIAAIIAAMRPYALSHRLGRVFAPQTTYHISGLPDREPDVTVFVLTCARCELSAPPSR